LSRPIIVRPLRESLVGNGIIPADDLQQTFATKSALLGHTGTRSAWLQLGVNRTLMWRHYTLRAPSPSTEKRETVQC
jgi:hypothetical protein